MPSESVSGVMRTPPPHVPTAWQFSPAVHALLSSHGVPGVAKPLSWQRPFPVHVSWSTQPAPASPQLVPAGASLAEQPPNPLHVSGSEHSLSAGSPQVVPELWNPSAGQVSLEPSQLSATSHSPAEA